MAALWPLLGVRFIGDDFIWVHEASQRTLAGCFQRGYFEFVRPMNTFFWMLMWKFSGTDPRGYHLLVLAVHALTALLLFRWLRETAGRPWPAFAGLCLFLAWPPHGEPLYWPAACSEVLAGAFVLGSLYAYRRWRLGGGVAWLAAALAALALGFGSKESSLCVLPGLVLVEVFLVRSRGAARGLATVLLPSLLILGAAALAVKPGHGYFTRPGVETVGVWVSYTSRAVLTPEVRDALVRLWPGSDFAVCAAVLALLAQSWRRAPAAAMHLAWLPFTVLPYALFVPHLPVSDRYFYLSSLALAGAVAGGLASLRPRRAYVAAAVVSLVVISAGLRLESEARRIAALYPLPQPETASLHAALSRRRPGAPVFVYCPPRVEIHPLYACAVLVGVPLPEIRPWRDALQEPEFPAGAVAVYWDQWSNDYRDITMHAARNLRAMLEEGRAPRRSTAPEELVTFPAAEDWEALGMQPGEDGSWHTPGVRGTFLSPPFRMSPYALVSVTLDLEVRSDGADLGTVLLDWESESRPAGHSNLEVSAPIAPGGIRQQLVLVPGIRPSWWTEGDIVRVRVIPSSVPATVRMRSIRFDGYPRL